MDGVVEYSLVVGAVVAEGKANGAGTTGAVSGKTTGCSYYPSSLKAVDIIFLVLFACLWL